MPWPRRIHFASSDHAVAAHWSTTATAFSHRAAYDLSTGTGILESRDSKRLHETRDPFDLLARMTMFARLATLPGARWLGYIGYEFNRCIEPLPSRTADPTLDWLPTFSFWLAADEPTDATAIQRASPSPARITERSFTPPAYRAAVLRSHDYITAGDIFQVNLSQRLSVQTEATATDVWSNLQKSTPAKYGALIDFSDDRAIVSNSPELFFKVDANRRIVSRPIKGTRPDQPGMHAELAASAKDRAELAMIVDLQRNDLGRVCEIGSVRVTNPREIEHHPTVLHGVATIEGTLRPDAGFADIVRALFPCGSITGCPKIRAMQIIDELEPVTRGPYCGAIGSIASDGTMVFNVAIRTITMAGGSAYVPVGGGIVADSHPQAEYDETLVKARAMLAALGVDRID